MMMMPLFLFLGLGQHYCYFSDTFSVADADVADDDADAVISVVDTCTDTCTMHILLGL